jgi:hypothetical protein
MTAAALSAAGRETVACEADPSGNDVGVMFDLGTSPGLVTLAAAARRGLAEPALVEAHGRQVADELLIVPGPIGAEESSSALGAVAASLGQVAASDSRLWVFDVGRLTANSPALPLARCAALTLIVCRPTPCEALALPPRVGALSKAGCRDLALVCVGKGSYGPSEIAEHGGIPLVGELPEERDAQGAISAAVSGRGRRTLLWRAAVELASAIGWSLARSDPLAGATVGLVSEERTR